MISAKMFPIYRSILKNCIQNPISSSRFFLKYSILSKTSNLKTIEPNYNHRVSNFLFRNYAKTKNIKKEKGKQKVDINPEQMAKIIDIESFQLQMKTLIGNMKEDYIKNLSLRSTSGSIESLNVSFEGKEYVLQELAQIVRKNPKTLIINMSTFPQAIPFVLKSIQESGMNLNPQQDGTTLFIPIPQITKEHRENLAKNAKAIFIKYRDGIKNVQNKNLRNIKKLNNISTDLIYNLQIYLENITETYVKEAEQILENKKNELVGKDKH